MIKISRGGLQEGGNLAATLAGVRRRDESHAINLLQQQLHSLTGKKHEIAQVFPDLPKKPRVRLASGVQQLKLLP